MTRFLMYTSAVLTFLMISGAALANPKHGHNGSHGNGFSSFHTTTHVSGFSSFKTEHNGFKGEFKTGYHLQFGKSFSHGFYYPGKSHSHWSYWGYSKTYGVNCYWCPYTKSYYYWHESSSRYYPVSYIGSAPPVRVPPQFGGPAGGPPAGVPAIP